MPRTDLWPESRIAELRELWNAKLTVREIGRRLGMSHSAIVGKARRLNLEYRGCPIKYLYGPPPYPAVRAKINEPLVPQDIVRVSVNKVEVSTMLKPIPAPVPAPIPAPRPIYVPIAVPTRTRGRCEWRDGHSPNFSQCTEPAVLAGPSGMNHPEGACWCPAHRARVYTNYKRHTT